MDKERRGEERRLKGGGEGEVERGRRRSREGGGSRGIEREEEGIKRLRE